MQEQQAQKQIKEVSEEIVEGTYANLAIITHSHAEFIIDFVNVMPCTPKIRFSFPICLGKKQSKTGYPDH
jgi:hypothetical protein